MVATPDPQVCDLGHLGLVAGIVDLIGSVASLTTDGGISHPLGSMEPCPASRNAPLSTSFDWKSWRGLAPKATPREGPLSAGEIAERFPLARSTLSRHLAVLQEVGLVEAEREGRRVYRLSASVLE